MSRFLTLKNNEIIGERYDSRNIIQEGEIEDDGSFGKFGETLINGVWQIDPQKIVEQTKQLRISELKEIITNKKYIDMNCLTEQLELKELLGL